MQENPYAPPQARVSARPVVLDDGSQVWRDGDSVLMTPSGDLPPRCVKCNADAEQPVRQRTLYWHTPWLYILVLISILIYIIVALIARKSIRVSPGLCTDHRVLRRNVILGSWLGALTGFGLIAVAISESSGLPALLGAVVLIGAMIFGMVKGRIIYAARIDQNRIELKGFGEPFLRSLPTRR
jgi:hypothetical protein